jgi:Ca2+-binding RTX toxin-like protein
VIGAKGSADLDTVAKLQALADAVQNVMDGDASVADLELLGLTTMGPGNERFEAGAGNDLIMGGYGDDVIIGGAGNDVMWGQGGNVSSPPPSDNDTFVWRAGDAGTGASDTLRDFVAWNGSTGDKLDISGLLQGYTGTNLEEWVTLSTGHTINGTTDSSRLTIDIDGAGDGMVTQVIDLQGTNLAATTLTDLLNNAVLIA